MLTPKEISWKNLTNMHALVTAIPVPGCTQRKGPGGYREVHRGNQRNSTCLGRGKNH